MMQTNTFTQQSIQTVRATNLLWNGLTMVNSFAPINKSIGVREDWDL